MLGRQKDAKSAEDLIRRGDAFRIGNDEEQSFEQAVTFYKKAAMKGSPVAQYLVGTMYESGHGVPQSYKEAAKWYEKSMLNGYKEATCSMAFLYEAGLGVKRSRPLAIEHYRTASQAGVHRATNNLGLIYKDKEGSDHSNHAAVVLFQKGNSASYYPCQANLAAMYEKGLDVKRACDIGANLFKKAAKQGSLFAKISLAEMYCFGLGLSQSDVISRHLYLEAARWGDPEALAVLNGDDLEFPPYSYAPGKATTPAEMLAWGLRFLDGASIGLSIPSALFYLESAAKGGNSNAMFVLGQIYENGYGVEKSLNVAEKWYRWGADKGNGACMYNLAYLTEGVNRSDASEIAFKLYLQASESDCDDDIKSDALYSLGLFYSEGVGTEQSDEKALLALVKSADLGNSSAQYYAGRMFIEGIGAEISEEKAVRYLRMAAEQGVPEAQALLTKLD